MTPVITFAPESTAKVIASATRSGRSIASSPALTVRRRHRGHTPAARNPLSVSATAWRDSPLAWP